MNQASMRAKFDSQSKLDIATVISIQKMILEHVLTGYEGLFGVDMIVEGSGKLRPFVEVNLRRTMGMIHIIP